MIFNRPINNAERANYLNELNEAHNDEWTSDDPRPIALAASLPAPPVSTNAQEAIAKVDPYSAPTYGLIRDREAAALLIAALAR